MIVTHAVDDNALNDFAMLMPDPESGRPGIDLCPENFRALERHTALFDIAAELLAPDDGDTLVRPPIRLVRAIAFDKRGAANWFVPWHQDVVRDNWWVECTEARGCKSRSPDSLLADMVSLRVHLDNCDSDNGPLEVVPGSHRLGVLDRTGISRLVEHADTMVCLADRGDILAMSPLVVHRSQRARCPGRRRVLHLEFTAASPH